MKKINKKSSVPLPKQIKSKILEDIKEGKFKPGEKFPSEEQLAKKFGVSRMTVREALVELMNEGFLYRVFGKGTFLKEDIGEKKEILKNKIIIKIPNLRLSFSYQIIEGAELVISQRGFEFKILSEKDNPIEERNIFEKILREKENGIIFLPGYYTYTNINYLKKLVEKMPVVLVNLKIPEVKVDTVISDDFKGGFLVTEHLIELGNKKILHLAGPENDSSADERKRGYLECIKKYELEPIIRYTRWTPEDGYFETKKVFLNRKDIQGIFCCNDEVAVGCYKALKEMKVKIPEDVSLAGYGNTEIGKLIEVPFTTVEQYPEEMGKIAATLLIDKIEGKRKSEEVEEVKVETKLIIRESCGIYIK